MRTLDKILICAVIIQSVFWVLLISGNLTLKGLHLTGAIKSTASHEHCKYDNSFIAGVDKNGSIQGSSLEAVNIRATGGAIVGWYFLNEGVLYQTGKISFGKVTYKNDNYPRGLPIFSEQNINIIPDYENKGLYIQGVYIDNNGLTGISDKEVQRIKNEINKEIDEKLSKGFVRCGK